MHCGQWGYEKSIDKDMFLYVLTNIGKSESIMHCGRWGYENSIDKDMFFILKNIGKSESIMHSKCNQRSGLLWTFFGDNSSLNQIIKFRFFCFCF